jgi:hypothetical protein
LQIMPQPDTPDSAGTDDGPSLLQFIRRPGLAVGRELKGIVQNFLFNFRGDTVADPRRTPGFLKKTFQTLFFDGSLDVVGSAVG